MYNTLGTTYAATKADGTTVVPGYTPPSPEAGASDGSITSMIPFWPWSGIAAAALLFFLWRRR